MKLNIFFEWNEQNGMLISRMYRFRQEVEESFNGKNYGNDIPKIRIVLSCLGTETRQRKRYSKAEKLLGFDVLVNYTLIEISDGERRKEIIKWQLIEQTEAVLIKYKFQDFNTAAFLADFKAAVLSANW